MNTRIASSLAMLAVLLVSACAPAASATPIAIAPPSESQKSQQQPLPTRAYELPMPTRAAEPTAPALEGPAPAATVAAPPPAPGQGENYFQDYGVNPQEQPLEDHLSTFAVDVDTASYTLTRRYIQDGALPPIDAVRTEEFVNALEQGYTPPRNAAFALYADGAPSPFDSGLQILRFGIQGYAVPAEERKTAALTFVIDVSGSMNMDNRLGLVKRALTLLVDQLRPDDSVAVVVYGSSARLVLPPTSGARKAEILRAVNSLRPEGSTNAEAGLRLGYRTAERILLPDGTNRVILCSDGVANTGNTDADTILEYVHGYVERGITLTTVGFGMGNYNDVLLEQLADRGNGSYHYVDTLEEARRLFIEKLTGTLQVIAYDAKVQVDFNPEVVAEYRLIGYENRAVADQDFRNDSVDAGEIGSGHTVTALYEVRLMPRAQGRIATLQLRWKDADTREVREINGNLNTFDLARTFNNTDPHFQQAVAAAAWAEVLRASPYTYASLDEIARIAARAAAQMEDSGNAHELADLIQRSAELTPTGE